MSRRFRVGGYNRATQRARRCRIRKNRYGCSCFMNNLALLVAWASALLGGGRVENVLMQDVGMSLKARIDSGAGVSSIHASVVRIEKAEDGRGERVVFKLRSEKRRVG